MADAKKNDPRTVFVRGIDASVTNEQLQEFFSEVGPVKNAFLVRRGKDGPHRGFGFVQFAVQEDAERAAAEVPGKELAGRKLKVEGAVKRAPLEERKKRKQSGTAAAPQQQQQQQQHPAAEVATAQAPAAKKPRPSKPAGKPSSAAATAAEAKHKWLRTVAIAGLTPEAVDSALQMARAAGEVEEVIRPMPDQLGAQFKLRRDGCTGESLLAVYKTVKQATMAVEQLHGQVAVAGGEPAAKKQKKGGSKAAEAGGGGAAGCRVWARQLSGDGLHQKRWRLIVRNLPFTASEADLRQAFAPAGFVWELSLPRSASGRGRGFAFVGFTCKAHAERGIRLVNATVVAGRPVAVDWAVAKAQYDTAQPEQEAGAAGEGGTAGAGVAGGSLRQLMGIDGVDSDSEDDQAGPPAQMGHEGDDGEAAAPVEPEQERRMLASVIDGILDGGGEEDEPEAAAEGLSESEEEDGSEDEDGDEAAQEESDSEEGEEEEEEADEEAPAASVAAADPFSRSQLQKKAEAAATAAAAVAPGADQGRQRAEPEADATVFIRGLPLDVGKEQVFLKMKVYGPVRSCRLVLDKDSGKLKGTAFVDFYRRASAQAASDACAKGRRKEGPGVVIGGRVADVDLAVGQEEARALAVAKAAERGPRDSRRLALAKEGQIVEGSPAWEDMSAGDRAKRKRAAEEKKLKLKSPNFVVSDCRLSVRNVPTAWTEKQLKQAFIAAVKERASKAQPQVKQVKILMDEERLGPDGTPRSKGIAFVEFTEHEHALCALRQLNNNPAAFSKERRPIVEFALENVKTLKLRETKLGRSKQPREQQQHQQQQERQGAGGAASGTGGSQQQQHHQQGEKDGAEAPEAKSKRKLRKERRLMLQERRKEQKQQEASGGGAAAANGTPASCEKSRSAKRRELRKRRQEGQQGVAPAAAAPAVKTAPATAAAAKPAKPAAGAKQQQQQQQQQRPRLGVNSRAAKVAATSQQEQQTQRRKRSADELIDKLAEGPKGELRARKQRKKEQTDSVDQLARQYLTKFFSDAPAGAGKAGKGKGGSSGNAGAAAGQRSALKRWFE